MSDGIPADVMAGAAGGLVGALRDRGFVVVQERYDEAAFGNVVLVLRRDETDVRLVRDRSQWFVDVEAAGRGQWFGLPEWVAFLDSSPALPNYRGLDEQAQVLLSELERIQAAIRVSANDALAWMRRQRDQRYEQRWGLPPNARD